MTYTMWWWWWWWVVSRMTMINDGDCLRFYYRSSENLTNRKWFNVVCTLIDNNIWQRYSSVVKMLWTHEVQPSESTIFNAKESFYFRAWPKSWLKERASVVYNFLTIWLVYFPKWAFLIGYYIAWQNDASMTCTVLSRLSSTTAN